MVVFLLLTALESRFGTGRYPLLYTAKVALVSLTTLAVARYWRPLLRFSPGAALLGALTGVAGLFLWLGLDRITPPLAILGRRTAFDPASLGAWQLPFLAVRFFGLALLVPLVEEVFWRGFLLRWVSDADRWEENTIESFTPMAALTVSGLFAAAHPEWLAALVYGLGLCALLKLTRSLLACLVCHGVTNLLLGIYVLLTRSWQLW
jgi:hypothetical protein